jgi:hypothetical protein
MLRNLLYLLQGLVNTFLIALSKQLRSPSSPDDEAGLKSDDSAAEALICTTIVNRTDDLGKNLGSHKLRTPINPIVQSQTLISPEPLKEQRQDIVFFNTFINLSLSLSFWQLCLRYPKWLQQLLLLPQRCSLAALRPAICQLRTMV